LLLLLLSARARQGAARSVGSDAPPAQGAALRRRLAELDSREIGAGAALVTAAAIKASGAVLIPVVLASLIKAPRRLLGVALGERGAARDAQLGASVVRGVGAAAGRAVCLAPPAHRLAGAGDVPDHRLGPSVGPAVGRDRLSPREHAARATAPPLRQGAPELVGDGVTQ